MSAGVSVNERELDRLSELTNIGAGHAATVYAQLSGRPTWMREPRVRPIDAVTECDPDGSGESSSGVFFEFEGCLGALVGLMFREGGRARLLSGLLGRDAADLKPDHLEAALMEAGNIIASHVASAIADTVGSTLLPSVPTLVLHGAEQQLAALAEGRLDSPGIAIECELCNDRGEVDGVLVLIPDRQVG